MLLSILASGLIFSCQSDKEVSVKRNKNIHIEDQQSPDEVSAIVAPYQETYNKEMSRILNSADEALLKGRPESALGNLLTDLSMQISEDLYKAEDGHGIDFCLLNDGGIRTNLPQG